MGKTRKAMGKAQENDLQLIMAGEAVEIRGSATATPNLQSQGLTGRGWQPPCFSWYFFGNIGNVFKRGE